MWGITGEGGHAHSYDGRGGGVSWWCIMVALLGVCYHGGGRGCDEVGGVGGCDGHGEVARAAEGCKMTRGVR